MSKIAIEPNLTPIGDYLTNKGYKVEQVNIGAQPAVNLNDYDAFILTGQSSNFLGIEQTETKAAVINASGMTPEDVYNVLKLQEKRPARKLIL